MSAKSFKHRVKGNIAKISGTMLAIFKQSFLLLRDAVKATIIVDDNGDRPVFLEGCLNRQPTRQKRSIATD